MQGSHPIMQMLAKQSETLKFKDSNIFHKEVLRQYSNQVGFVRAALRGDHETPPDTSASTAIEQSTVGSGSKEKLSQDQGKTKTTAIDQTSPDHLQYEENRLIIYDYLKQLELMEITRERNVAEGRPAAVKKPRLQHSLPKVSKRNDKYVAQPQDIMLRANGKSVSPLRLVNYTDDVWKKDPHIERALLKLNQPISVP